jgi:hypothetical protein
MTAPQLAYETVHDESQPEGMRWRAWHRHMPNTVACSDSRDGALVGLGMSLWERYEADRRKRGEAEDDDR